MQHGLKFKQQVEKLALYSARHNMVEQACCDAMPTAGRTMQIWSRRRLNCLAMFSSMNSAGLPTVMGSRWQLPTRAPTCSGKAAVRVV